MLGRSSCTGKGALTFLHSEVLVITSPFPSWRGNQIPGSESDVDQWWPEPLVGSVPDAEDWVSLALGQDGCMLPFSDSLKPQRLTQGRFHSCLCHVCIPDGEPGSLREEAGGGSAILWPHQLSGHCHGETDTRISVSLRDKLLRRQPWAFCSPFLGPMVFPTSKEPGVWG